MSNYDSSSDSEISHKQDIQYKRNLSKLYKRTIDNDDDDPDLNNPFDGDMFVENSICSTISELSNLENDRSYSEVDVLNGHLTKQKRNSVSSTDSLQLLTNEELQRNGLVIEHDNNSADSSLTMTNINNRTSENSLFQVEQESNKEGKTENESIVKIDKKRSSDLNCASLIDEISKLQQKVAHSNHLIENLECNGNCQPLPLIHQSQQQIVVLNNCDISQKRVYNDEGLVELEKKHRNELENLRKYYEKKCVDLEKSFSEEVFKQKKLNERETDSETSISEPLDSKSVNIDENVKYKILKQEIQNKYFAELEILRGDYESQLDILKLENDNLKDRINNLENQEEINKNQLIISEQQMHDIQFNLIQQLEQQIKNFLQNESNKDDNIALPKELLMLGRCFTEKLTDSYEQQLNALKEEMIKNDQDHQLINNMKIFIKKLISYFYECENELNGSLIEELLRINLSQTQTSDQILSDSMKRLHFTPDSVKMIEFLNNSMHDSNFDLSFELNSELKNHLKKFKLEAEEILIESVKFRAMVENKDSLVNEIKDLIEEKNQLCADLKDIRNKKFAVINTYPTINNNAPEDSSSSYTDSLCSHNLHNKVQVALLEKPENNKDKFLINLIKDLNNEVDKLKSEKNDFKLQIETFSQKLKKSQDFVNQQILDYENERDEWEAEKQTLHEYLNHKSKEIENCRKLSFEINELEEKQSETLNAIDEAEERNIQLEKKLNIALNDNQHLQKNIRDLRNELVLKQTTEKSLINRLNKLHEKLAQLELQKQHLLNDDNDSATSHSFCECGNNNHDDNYVISLEKELEQYKMQFDIVESEAMKSQLKFQLKEFEIAIENRTNEIESQCKKQKPKMNSNSSNTVSEEISAIILPEKVSDLNKSFTFLDIVRSVFEKWRRHTYIEDNAIKYINDLELKIATMKSNEKQLEYDRETLQNNIIEDGILISTLQLRLDEQRMKIEDAQKDRNLDLLNEIEDLKNEIAELNNDLINRNKEILDLKQTIESTNQLTQELYKELKLSETERKETLNKFNEIEKQNINLTRLLDDSNDLRRKMMTQIHSDDELCVLRNTHRDYSFKSNEFMNNFITIDHKFVSTPNISDFEQRELHSLTNSPINKRSRGHIFDENPNEIDLNKSLNEKNKQLKNLENIIKINLEKFNKLNEDWKNQEKLLVNKITNFETESVKLHNELNTKENMMEKLETDLKEHKSVLTECNEKIKLLENLKNNFSTKLNEKEIQEKKLNETIKKLENQIDNFNKEILNIRESIKNDNAKLEISHLKNILKKKDDMIFKLTGDCKNIRYAMELIRKKFIANFQVPNSNESLKEINDKVKQQLNYSQNLDASILSAIEEESVGRPEISAISLSNSSSCSHSSSDDFQTQSDEVKRLRIKLRREKIISEELLTSNKLLVSEFQKLSAKFDQQKLILKESKQIFENEKENFNSIRIQDANIIKNLESRLSNALKDIMKLEENLHNEKMLHEKLQMKLCNIQQNQSFINYSTSLPLLTDQKDSLKTENKKLKMRLDTLENQNIDYVKQLEKNRIKFQNQIEVLENSIVEYQDLISVQKNICKDHTNDLQKTITELESTKILLNETDEEKQSILAQFEQFKKMKINENKKLPISEQVTKKLKELTFELTKHMIDNKQMNQVIRKLTEERLKLQNRVEELECFIKSHELDSDSVVSINYLFKSLNRLKSYQKILIWQKRYLENLLNEYRTKIILPIDYKCVFKTFSIVNKFKSVSFAIIAIIRLKNSSKRECLMNKVQINGEQIKLNRHCDNRYALSVKKVQNNDNQIVKKISDNLNTNLKTSTMLSKYLSAMDHINDQLNLNVNDNL